jgi:hypothetical protein
LAALFALYFLLPDVENILHSTACIHQTQNIDPELLYSALQYYVYYGNKCTSSSVFDIDHIIIIRKLLDAILNILPVFIYQWEIQILTHRTFLP